MADKSNTIHTPKKLGIYNGQPDKYMGNVSENSGDLIRAPQRRDMSNTMNASNVSGPSLTPSNKGAGGFDIKARRPSDASNTLNYKK